MKRNAIISASLIAVVISFSFLALACPQGNGIVHLSMARDVDNTQRLIFSAPLIIGTSFQENSRLLNQSTRMEIYSFVKGNPGIHFRAICDKLGLSIGVVQYHLSLLTSAGLLSVCNDGRCKRYFESKAFEEADMKTISLLRHQTPRRILTALSQGSSILHKDLACMLGMSSQALTWQINRLKKTGFLEAVKEGMSVKYFLNRKDAMFLKQYLSLVG